MGKDGFRIDVQPFVPTNPIKSPFSFENQKEESQTKLKGEKPVDPCFGKPKEFFVYEMDLKRNVCICTADQMEFIALNYKEHYYEPIEKLKWLQNQAIKRDNQFEKK